jgi:hypothetical protein
MHEMPGGTHDVGTQDCALVKQTIELGLGGPAGALAERPFSAGVVLRLHRAQPAHRGDRRGERLTGEPLRVEASGSDIKHSANHHNVSLVIAGRTRRRPLTR